MTPPIFRDVRCENNVSNALDAACLRWQAAEKAWSTIELILAYDPFGSTSRPLYEGTALRVLRFEGVRSLGLPDITVIYEADANVVRVLDAVFSEAKFPFSGKA